MPEKYKPTLQSVIDAEDVLCELASNREFLLSEDARQEMLSVAHNLNWLRRQADFLNIYMREEIT